MESNASIEGQKDSSFGLLGGRQIDKKKKRYTQKDRQTNNDTGKSKGLEKGKAIGEKRKQGRVHGC